MRCAHARAVPVESAVTGEVLAALCPVCDHQLPADFLGCPHENVIDIMSLGEPPGLGICNDCGTSGWYGRPQELITSGADANTEDLEAFRARFLAVQLKPYRTLYLPPSSACAPPTLEEIEGGP